ncbi:glycosyltransferase [Clostridium senegalense]|uniref:glycosyltransferase n=1 Tax=Clostridium senegalense TaxID=1465809 RepID=UPI002E1BEF12
MKIKVLHIISGNDNGGGASHVLSLCSKDNKYFENVLGCVGEGYLSNKVKNTKINYKIFQKKVINTEIVKYAEENDIDIVNFHGASPFLIHFFIKNKIKCKTVATVHSDYRYDFLNNKFKYYLYTPLSSLGLKSFENYITVSENLLRLLEEKQFEGKKAVVNNGIRINKFIEKESSDQLKNKFKINEDDFVFGVIARFHPIKNHENIIRAFAKFNNDNKNSKLLLLGDGESKDRIKELIVELNLEKEVILGGFVENVGDYLKICDCTIIASYSEGGAPPLAMLESAAMEIPVITTKVGDLENIINFNNGILIKSQGEKDIYISMLEAYDKGENLKVLGHNIKNLVLKEFTMSRFWQKYHNFYKEILKDKH